MRRYFDMSLSFPSTCCFLYILKKKIPCVTILTILQRRDKNLYVCRYTVYTCTKILEGPQNFCRINFLRNLGSDTSYLQNLPHSFRLYLLISFSGKSGIEETLDMWICKITPVFQNATFYFFIVTGALTPHYTIPYNKSIIPQAHSTFKTQDLEKIIALEENINFTVQILIQKYHVAMLLYSNLKRNL